MRTKALLLGAAAAALLASPTLAHRPWLLPSTTTLSNPGDYVTVDGAVSNDLFYADHQPLRMEQVKVWAPDGSAGGTENGATGKYRSTFDVKIDKPGTWKIGTEQTSVVGTFKVNGEEWRVGGRRGPPAGGAAGAPPGSGAMQAQPIAFQQGGGEPLRPQPKSVASVADIPANATDVKLTETSQRNSIFVSLGEPSDAIFKPTGKGLELQPVTHPDSLVSNEEGQFRYLVDGKPAAGVKVSVIPGNKKFRDAEQAQDLTTGADGMLRVKWPTPGIYWISATAGDNHPTTPRATDRRMTYVMTVEVPAP